MKKIFSVILLSFLFSLLRIGALPPPPPPPFPPPPPPTNTRTTSTMVNIQVNTNPSGAFFSFDGQNYGPTPSTVSMQSGKTYNITFRKDGFSSFNYSYTCNGSSINVTLNSSGVNRRENTRVELDVSINSNPSGANVSIDNRSIGQTPANTKLEKGKSYNLSFSKPGYDNYNMTYFCDGSPVNVTLNRAVVYLNVNINSNPDRANLSINGQDYGQTPVNGVPMEKGQTYNIVASKTGYESKTVNYVCNGSPVAITLNALTKKLTINSNVNNAQVFINRTDSGKTPLTINLNPGNYTIEVRYPGYRTFTGFVDMTNQDQTIYANLEPEMYINIKLPKNAELYVNGEKQRIMWRNNQTDVFQIFSTTPAATVKVVYYDLVFEKQIQFNRSTYTVFLDLR